MTTKEQVTAWAREAGFSGSVAKMWGQHFEAFATLVRNATAIEERTALAEVCDAMGSPNIAKYLREQAEAIRNLKDKS